MRHPLDDQRMAGMRDEIDRINALADRSPGYVWRFKTAGGDATDVRVLDDWRVLFNLTIWRSLDALQRYVYHSEHAVFFRRRREWFLPAAAGTGGTVVGLRGAPSGRGRGAGTAPAVVAARSVRRGLHSEACIRFRRTTAGFDPASDG